MENSDNYAYEERWNRVKNKLEFETWTEFAQYFDSNDNKIRSYRKKIADIPRELEKKLRDENINVDWLLTGEGPMLLSEMVESQANANRGVLQADAIQPGGSNVRHAGAPLLMMCTKSRRSLSLQMPDLAI